MLPSLPPPVVSWVSGHVAGMGLGVSVCSSTHQGSCVVSGKHTPFDVQVRPVASPLLSWRSLIGSFLYNIMGLVAKSHLAELLPLGCN